MKRILPLTLFALLGSSLTFAQVQNKNDKERDTKIEQTLRNIEQEISDGVVKNDADVLQRYYADTCIVTLSDGSVSDKASLIAMVKSGDLKLESKIDRMKVRLYGNTAVVTYRSTDKGTYKGEDLSGQSQWTDTFVKIADRWQLVADQGTRISQTMPLSASTLAREADTRF